MVPWRRVSVCLYISLGERKPLLLSPHIVSVSAAQLLHSWPIVQAWWRTEAGCYPPESSCSLGYSVSPLQWMFFKGIATRHNAHCCTSTPIALPQTFLSPVFQSYPFLAPGQPTKPFATVQEFMHILPSIPLSHGKVGGQCIA